MTNRDMHCLGHIHQHTHTYSHSLTHIWRETEILRQRYIETRETRETERQRDIRETERQRDRDRDREVETETLKMTLPPSTEEAHARTDQKEEHRETLRKAS